MKSPFILECLVWGDTNSSPGEEPEVQAIVVPNTEYLISQGIATSTLDNGKVESILRKEVKDRCQSLASFKRVTKLTVRHEEFEKTTTKKIKRYLYTGRADRRPGAGE